MSDQDSNSPLNINTKSSGGTKEKYNKWIVSWSNTKFSEVV